MSFSAPRSPTSPQLGVRSFVNRSSVWDPSPRRSPDRSVVPRRDVLYSRAVDSSTVWDLSPWGPDRGHEEQTARKLQNLHYHFPSRSWRQPEDALTQAGGHAGKARKQLRMSSSEGAARRSTSPPPRAYVSPVASRLPELLQIEGLQHIGALYCHQACFLRASLVTFPHRDHR